MGQMPCCLNVDVWWPNYLINIFDIQNNLTNKNISNQVVCILCIIIYDTGCLKKREDLEIEGSSLHISVSCSPRVKSKDILHKPCVSDLFSIQNLFFQITGGREINPGREASKIKICILYEELNFKYYNFNFRCFPSMANFSAPSEKFLYGI